MSAVFHKTARLTRGLPCLLLLSLIAMSYASSSKYDPKVVEIVKRTRDILESPSQYKVAEINTVLTTYSAVGETQPFTNCYHKLCAICNADSNTQFKLCHIKTIIDEAVPSYSDAGVRAKVTYILSRECSRAQKRVNLKGFLAEATAVMPSTLTIKLLTIVKYRTWDDAMKLIKTEIGCEDPKSLPKPQPSQKPSTSEIPMMVYGNPLSSYNANGCDGSNTPPGPPPAQNPAYTPGQRPSTQRTSSTYDNKIVQCTAGWEGYELYDDDLAQKVLKIYNSKADTNRRLLAIQNYLKMSACGQASSLRTGIKFRIDGVRTLINKTWLSCEEAQQQIDALVSIGNFVRGSIANMNGTDPDADLIIYDDVMEPSG